MRPPTGAHGRRAVERVSNGAAAFELVWSTLVNILGTAATASLVRKAARQGAAKHRELEELVVRRDGLDYAYCLPSSWERTERPAALMHLVRHELLPLLSLLTGDLVLRHLERVPELKVAGFLCSNEVEHA